MGSGSSCLCVSLDGLHLPVLLLGWLFVRTIYRLLPVLRYVYRFTHTPHRFHIIRLPHLFPVVTLFTHLTLPHTGSSLYCTWFLVPTQLPLFRCSSFLPVTYGWFLHCHTPRGCRCISTTLHLVTLRCSTMGVGFDLSLRLNAVPTLDWRGLHVVPDVTPMCRCPTPLPHCHAVPTTTHIWLDLRSGCVACWITFTPAV